MSKNLGKSLVVGGLMGASIGASAQSEEKFTCGHDHTKNYPIEQTISPRDGEYRWTDCDTIRTYLISILPTPRADNWDMFYEGLDNIKDQVEIEDIKNLGIAHINWSEMSSRLQDKENTRNVMGIYSGLHYEDMPTVFADTLKNIIDNHSPDIIFLELPSQYPGDNYSVAGPGRGMIIIKSYSSDNMYKVAITHEGGHEMSLGHDDNSNNAMNTGINGGTSPNYTPEHTEQAKQNYVPHLIDTNPDRNCEIVGIEDIQLDENSIKLYPNPATSSHFTLESVTEPITKVRLYNQLGQLYTYLPRDTQEAHLLDISLDGITAGLWYATIETEKGIATKKVFVAK